MADRTVDPVILPVTITTPVATATTAPQTTVLTLLPGRLQAVEIQIPPGHAGITGIRIEVARQQIIPYSASAAWILGDNYTHDFPIDFEIGTGVQVVTYNTGNYPHSHFLRFTVRKLAQPLTVVRPTIVPITPRSAAS